MRSVLFIVALIAAAGGCDASNPSPRPEFDAQRIVSLAPHLTELVYTAGAGDKLVGVVEYSDYPPAARSLPRIGDAFRIDMEALATLRPDVILAWQGGNPDALIDNLRRGGYRVEAMGSRNLDDVAVNLLRIGKLDGTSATAERAARAYRQKLNELRATYRDRRRVTVFYQIAARPLYTVGGQHNISRLLDLCGGDNIFAGLAELAPAVAEEAVLAADPEVLVTSAPAEDLRVWDRWPDMRAVRAGNLAHIDGDLVSRDSTRLLEGALTLCKVLDAARAKRRANSMAID